MPDEVVDEVVGTGTQKIGGALRRGVIEETVHETTGQVTRGKASNNAIASEEDEVRDNGGRTVKPLKESTKKLLAVVDEAQDDEEEGSSDPDDVGLIEKSETKPDPDDIVEEKTETEAKVETKTEEATEEKKEEEVKDEKPSDYDEIRSDRERLADTNRRLVMELDAERKRPRNEMNERLKALDEADRTYLDDPIKAYRIFVATVLNVKPDSKEVDEELSGFYTDLTAKELNVPLEAAHKATREAARTKQQLARDKRERQAESEASKNKSTEDTDTKQAAQATEFITRLFNDKQDLREKYPLLMQLSETFDGMKPEMVLWRVIQRDSKAGVIKVTDNDVDTVEQAAKIIEAHYEAVLDRASKAKQPKKTDTTKQVETKTNANTDSKEKPRQGSGTRTITNASASVAPATPPAKKQTEKQTDRPKFKSKKEAQDWALRHIPD